MSIAGTRSHQGDEYQMLIAIHWLIQLLDEGEKIKFIQAESNGLPGEENSVSVDDVVVVYENGQKLFIQVKKNQPNLQAWSLSDSEIKQELIKARDQLEADDQATVKFYSRSSFRELQKLSEGGSMLPDNINFQRDAPNTLKQPFEKLIELWERTEEESFALHSRLKFAIARDFYEWETVNEQNLKATIARPKDGIRILRQLLTKHQTKLEVSKHTITRDDVIRAFSEEGLYLTPAYSETDTLDRFRTASAIGRSWLRKIDGKKIPRSATTQLLEAINNNDSLIMLTDGPGTGKTCVLLEIADTIESDPSRALLFIRGDEFTEAKNLTDLQALSLPDDIEGRCSRLATIRQVVVLVDSLDLLSIQSGGHALSLFLSLIDRLAKIPNVTVVAACRKFDLEYHTKLRHREWNSTIQVGLLDFESEVSPMVTEWGADPATFSDELKKILCTPQNLRLFQPLADSNKLPSSTIRSAYQLNERFLQEIVIDDHNLGSAAINNLQNMALRLLNDRAKSLSRAAFSTDDRLINRLISKGILFKPTEETLDFTHQTLRESLIVRATIANGTGLTDFIKNLPPLPFIRPAVRAFVLHLHAAHPESFGREISPALADEDIAYHIRRLLAETVTELEPTDRDWSWVRRFFQNQPDLFRRFFSKAQNDAWFHLLHDKWLPALSANPDKESWYKQFLFLQNAWLARFPDKLITLWQQAFAEGWGDRWELNTVLRDFKHWGKYSAKPSLKLFALAVL